VFLHADRGDDAGLGVFQVAVADLLPPPQTSEAPSNARRHRQNGGEEEEEEEEANGVGAGGFSDSGVSWVQRWCASEHVSGSSESSSVLLLLRARVVPLESARLRSELRCLAHQLRGLQEESELCFAPLSSTLAPSAVGALERALAAATKRLRAREATPLEWWTHELSGSERRWWAGATFALVFVLVGLAVGLGPHHPLGRRARAVGLLLQACWVWELCNYAAEPSSGVGEALEAAPWWLPLPRKVDSNLLLVACTVGKVGVTAAIFHGVLVFFGADGGGALFGGYGDSGGGDDFGSDPLTPLLWVWFFGILTGHLVFGRLAHEESLEYLRVDMEAAREAIAEAEDRDRRLEYEEEQQEIRERLAAEEVEEEAMPEEEEDGVKGRVSGLVDEDGGGHGSKGQREGGSSKVEEDPDVTWAWSNESDGHVGDLSTTHVEESY